MVEHDTMCVEYVNGWAQEVKIDELEHSGGRQASIPDQTHRC